MATLAAPACIVEVVSSWSSGGDPEPPVEPEIVDPLPVTLTSPADGETVITATPKLIVGVDTDADDDDTATYTITVQYAANDTFTGATTLTGDFDATDGGVELTPVSAVPNTTFWRARLSQGSVVRSAWTEPAQFTVSTGTSATQLFIAWTVDPAAARPIHLWHVDPVGPDAGDKVTVYGQGFPASGRLTFGDGELTVTSWQRVAASDENTSGNAKINGDVVDPEHYEVTFIAPNYNGPGEALTVEA